jgi:selenocysteine lyase/cysteine desulfurase
MDKRRFLKTFSSLGVIPFIGNFSSEYLHTGELDYSIDNSTEQSFWKSIRNQYKLTSDFINLESGYYNIIPSPILDKLQKHLEKVNLEGSLYMRKTLENDREKINKDLAAFVGCSPNNLIITRNTTESLDMIISGFPWKQEDEIIYAYQDYGAMRVMIEQVVDRHKIKAQLVSVPNHPSSDQEIVDLYSSKINKKTKLILVSHMVNITGQILPVRKICDMAHQKGVEVLVDGAHCIGHFDFKISELNCDYYGSSLHKWLAAPLGNGLLYIKQKHISKIWPLFADYIKDKKNIKRLNHLGTHPAYITLGIRDAIQFLDQIGIHRKQKRLVDLRTYWMTALKGVSNVVLNTPLSNKRACGIGNIGLQNMTPKEFSQKLFSEHNIFTVAIDENNVRGCRITPNIFTDFEELDVFIGAVKTLAKA